MLLGVDICACDRIAHALRRSPFLQDELFSPAELAYCATAAHPEQHLAARWAAKEACVKAFGLSILGYDLRQLEVAHDATGRPRLDVHCPRLRDDMRRAVGDVPFHIHLALSHEAAYAVASVVVTP